MPKLFYSPGACSLAVHIVIEQQIDGHDWVVDDKRTIIDAYALLSSNPARRAA